jgi:acetyltransferase-like isoleucine patch superfamily enzyme
MENSTGTRGEKRPMGILSRFRARLARDPNRAIVTNKNVRMGNSQLGEGFGVRLDVPRDDIALTIGDRCILMNQFVFESDRGKITVGNGVFINSGTMVISRSLVEIGNNVTIAWGCVIYDHNSHSISYLDRVKDQDQQLIDLPTGSLCAHKDWSKVETAPIRICDHAWLGFDVAVLKGVTVGEGAIIGARAVVTRDIPPWTIAAGNPAKVVKEIPRELRKPCT